MILFTDSSVSSKQNLGVGGYLRVYDASGAINLPGDLDSVQLRTFTHEGISSTELELKTLIWALDKLQTDLKGVKLTVYTDSQNVAGLIERRARLEQKGFRNRSGDLLKQARSYKLLFELLDKLSESSEVEIIKIKGHQRKSERSELEKLFSLVDQATRRRLRSLLADKGIL